MAKTSKRFQEAVAKVDSKQKYAIEEAIKLAKETASTKFDATVDVAFNLNLDPTKAEQQLRGALNLPHGSGKTVKVLVVAEEGKHEEAKSAGADHVGGEEIIEKIKSENWFDFDVVVATPAMMPKIGRIGQILGPKGLMPNPKTGTVTPDVVKAVTEIKAGKITYRIDKFGNVHALFGKVSFDESALLENFMAIFNELQRVKPSSAKGIYMKNVSISTTMGPGIKIDVSVL